MSTVADLAPRRPWARFPPLIRLVSTGSWALPVTGLLSLMTIHGPMVHHRVLLRIVWGVTASWLVGQGIERHLGIEKRAAFPFHQVVLGQVALVVYFYFRSALCGLLHLPGVTAVELLLVGGALALSAAWRAGPEGPVSASSIWARAVVWGAWWVSAMVFLAPASGMVGSWSGDPEYHAFLAHLTDVAGHVAYVQAPYSHDPVVYSSGFAVLNAVWMRLTGLDPAAVASMQVLLQGMLMTGLVLEALVALVGAWPMFAALLVIGLAHWVFTVPVNAVWRAFEGTSRLSHTALALFPLTYALRLSRGALSRGATLWLGGAICTFSLGWAFALNPAFLAVAGPLVLAAAVVLMATARGSATTPVSRRWMLACAGLAVSAPALVVLGDAWVYWQLRGVREGPGSAAYSPVRLDAHRFLDAFSGGWQRIRATTLAGVLPDGCQITEVCPASFGPLIHVVPYAVYLLALVALVLATRREFTAEQRRPLQLAGVTVFATAVASWLSGFGDGAVDAFFADARGHSELLLRGYTRMGLEFSTAHLLLLLIAEGLALSILIGRCVSKRRGLAWLDAAVSGAVAALASVFVLTHLSVWRDLQQRYVKLVLSMPNHLPDAPERIDIDFARRLDDVIPPGKRVLLPSTTGAITEGTHYWLYTVGPIRVIPLYSKVDFAYFQGLGHAEFDAHSYDVHVCQRFDLPWLAEHDVDFVAISNEARVRTCLHGWEQARDKYFTKVAGLEDRALYQLDRTRLAAAASDPELGMP